MTNINFPEMHETADMLTKQMDAIFAPYADELEAPEFMEGEDLENWNTLHKQREIVFDFIKRMEAIWFSYKHYNVMELV